MISSMVIVLLAASSAFAFPADTPAGGCPGGYAEGAEIERGRLVFLCQGGQVVPKACIAEDLSRIPIGGNYDKNNQYRKRCQAQGNDLSYELVGCLANGQEHRIGESWEDGTNFYTCKQDGAFAKPETQGCVDGGRRINKKEKVTKQDAVYLCDETVNGGAKLIQAGCVKDGREIAVGDALESGKYWFNCTRTGREKVQVKIAGCVANGKRLNDGDRYQDNEVIYECNVDANTQTVRAIACVQRDTSGGIVERKLGCTWVDGTAPFQYEWECKHDAAANTAVKAQVRCNYNVGGGVYNINPGCFRVIDKAAFGCVKSGSSLNLQSFQGDNAQQAASSAGLSQC